MMVWTFVVVVVVALAEAGQSLSWTNNERSFDRNSDIRSNNNNSNNNKNIVRLELYPTASLVHERRRKLQQQQRPKRKQQPATATPNQTETTTSTAARYHSSSFHVPPTWFHPWTRAVYATLQQHPPQTSTSDGDTTYSSSTTTTTTTTATAAEAYQDFVKYRHLSRFERHLRTTMKWDLHPHWHGNYTNTTFYQSTRHPQHHHHQQRRRHLLESMVGGRFDNYQAVPLSQGYGTHFVAIYVGSPIPQRQSVIVDTGSHFTGFPVKGCASCGERHHTDPHFDPTKSDTFRPLQCPHECLENYSCDSSPLVDYHKPFTAPRCKFKQAYTEGSSWVAYQAQDIVYCGGTDLIDAVDPTDIKYSIPFVFGCLQENTGLFVTQLADGIMGMSAHELTITKQLYNAGKLEYNMFALCFRKELGTSKRGVTAGSMTLGGVSSTLDTSPMIYARNIQPFGWYTVFVQAMYIAKNGGSKFLFDSPESTKNIVKIPIDHSQINVGRGVIVDSGTTDTYINSNVQAAFVKIWKQVTGMEYTHGPIYLTQTQLKRLPTLLVQLQAAQTQQPHLEGLDLGDDLSSPVVGQAGYLDPERWSDLLLAIPATNYMEYSPTLKVYTSRLFFTESRGGVLGANAMQGHNVLFDWQHGRIGFAQSSCAYDLIAGKNDNHVDFGASSSSSESFTSECILATDRPILSQTCMDSVSIAICEAYDHPTNIDISGVEIWTLLVEAPGDEGSCQVAMQKWSEFQDTVQQVDPSTTNCTLDGICQEFRPCHVPCMKAIEYHRKKRNGDPLVNEAVTIPHTVLTKEKVSSSKNLVTEGCKEWQWSACDYACRQTRITSSRVEHDAGQFCMETSRETRNCHVDACGRSDPCMVPFLVHAIFVLEGSAIEWTPQFEHHFCREFTKASQQPNLFSEKRSKDISFDEGDINILATRPWYGSDNDDSFGNDEVDAILEEEKGDTKADAVGIQVILQISISNPKAQKIPRRNGARTLLQEVDFIWTNLTQVFRSSRPTTVCDPYDLYPLAMDAHEIANNLLSHPYFQMELIYNLQEYDNIRLVSSWTIGTQVYDEYINYLGPLASTPFFIVVKFLHEAFVFMTVAWLAIFTLKACRLFRGCAFRSFQQKAGAPNYKPVSTKDQDEDESNINARGVAGQRSSTMEVELSTVTYLRSKAMKRRHSTTEQ
ncbi:aspartic peptidase domain containing protein [Nitzschia inconspicua]|uniref:Aspartic peptidase domain containing protein n=1 Tax=Nitzschia inconspicua TaxID=303405 RepID=A0A9K3PUC0_9STRA|nr:aspartic peptidase domain containing protein [Nitzschia inconspicua]